MAEFRHEYLDDRWTLYAPERAGRPFPARPKAATPPPFDPECPFCPGHEAMLAPIVAEAPAVVAGDPWATRSVLNKYPVLRPEPGPAEDPARVLRGGHEVLVETPRHDRDLVAMAPEELRAAVALYRDRQAALEARWGWALVFRNRTPGAGATMVHPHAQAIAAEAPPPPVAAREARAGAYLARHGRAYLDAAVARERERGERLVLDRDGFVAFVPEAAEAPYEVWLTPTAWPRGSFAAVEDGAELAAFADALGALLRALDRCIEGGASYNFAIQSASRALQGGGAWRWFLRLRPRIGHPGGFEIAAEVSVNWSRPERDAARLREAV